MLSALANFESQLTTLLNILTTSPTASSAPGAAEALLDADDALSSALATLRTHQANYERILRLRSEAASLEENIKTTVKDVIAASDTARRLSRRHHIEDLDSDEESDSSSSSSSRGSGDGEEHTETIKSESGYHRKKKTPSQKRKEVDYRLLLDFARRISKYNHQAAADAANGSSRGIPTVDGGDMKTTQAEVSGAVGVNGDQDQEAGGPSGLATVTKNATQWLDESAKLARQVYMIPYPAEDRIRMGLMAQLQVAASEGKSNPDEEAEKLVREAEGIGSGIASEIPVGGIEDTPSEFVGSDAARKDSLFTEGSRPRAGAAPVPAPSRPKGTLDLDLYDPDDDDM